MQKKVLFVGCSHTANSGFLEVNAPKYHWPWLFCQEFDCYFYNAGIGGSSNDEIFYRSLDITLNNKFDLVIVMWSAIGRKWVYFQDNNVDDYTIINNGVPGGFNSSESDLAKYAKIHYLYLNNQYVQLKQWLLQTISLAAFLKNQNTEYIFVRGFDNYLQNLLASEYLNPGFNIADDLKKILNFDNNSDWYIQEKLDVLKKLAINSRSLNWLNFDSPAFFSSEFKLDKSDDGMHLGAESNKKFYSTLSDFYKKSAGSKT